MQRPRLIATTKIIADTKSLIDRDAKATAELDALKKRIEKIFKMDLLSYSPPPPPPGQVAAIQLAAAAPPTTFGDDDHEGAHETSPLDFLADPGSFEPRPIGWGEMVPQGLGFAPKGYKPLEIAKVALSRLQALGLAWLLTGEQRYADRGVREIEAVCRLPHWGEDHHLATATFLQAVAMGYDWFYGPLGAARAATRTAMIEKGMAPMLAAYQSASPPNWISVPSNWNVVCNASILIAALAIGPDSNDARIAALRKSAEISIAAGMQLYAPDGTWRLEGPGYWHLATEHLVNLLAALDTSGEDVPAVTDHPGVARTGTYRSYIGAPSSALFNYGDSEERRPGLWWLRWLATKHGHDALHDIAEDRSGRFGAAPEVHPFDLIWRRPTPAVDAPAAMHSLPTSAVFCEAAVLRGRWDDEHAAYVGIKAGETSGLRSHSHLDLGHFVYEAGGVRWAVDLEPDDYGMVGYLEPPERYRYYRANTFGHNTLVIGGVNQAYVPAGASLPPVTAAFGPVLLVPGGRSIAVDLTAAYPAATSVRRTFTLVDDGDLVIADDISIGDEPKDVVWSMHTPADVTCDGGHATLTSIPKNPGEVSLTLQVTVSGVAGAVFQGAEAGAMPAYVAGENAETAPYGINRLSVTLGPIAGAVHLEVKLSLERPA